MIPAILDIEASALGGGSYPIEVGFVLPDYSSRCLLIKPQSDWNGWNADAERLHGIARGQLLLRGLDVGEVAVALNDYLRGMTVYSDAWGNDQTWLALLFDRAGIVQRFRLQTLRALLSERQLELWIEVKQQIVVELALGRHRASADARILQLTYLRTLEIATREGTKKRRRA